MKENTFQIIAGLFGISRGYGIDCDLVYRKVRGSNDHKISLPRMNTLRNVLLGLDTPIADLCNALDISRSEDLILELFKMVKN